MSHAVGKVLPQDHDGTVLLARLLTGTHADPGSAARHLMEVYPSFQHAVRAEPSELSPLIGPEAARVLSGVVPAVCALTRAALHVPRTKISDFETARTHLAARLNGRRNEAGVILYLDRKNRLIGEDVLEGTVDRAPIYPREVIRRALLLDATAILMAHNHPSGHVEPSEPDITLTRAIVTGLRPFDCVLHDHLIFGVGAPYSFRASGRLDRWERDR